jgi:DNA-binding transcriptional ArsR family regulator
VSQQAVKQHLAVLDRAGLVEARREGTRHVYAVWRSGQREWVGSWFAWKCRTGGPELAIGDSRFVFSSADRELHQMSLVTLAESAQLPVCRLMGP